MHERYAALFGLRNRGGAEAVAAIIASLNCESALLKHEVCITLLYSKSLYLQFELQEKSQLHWLTGCFEHL